MKLLVWQTYINDFQLGTLTADVFKGAGEDAGGVVKVLAAYKEAIEDAKAPLTGGSKITSGPFHPDV